MSTNNHLVQAVEEFATKTLLKHQHKDMQFHTLSHTQQVVEAVKEIAGKSGLSPKETELTVIAAWFHDLGYTQRYKNHEEVSKEIAKNFFSEKDLSPEDLEEILNLINATRIDVKPQNLPEKVIKDADLSNLATPQALAFTSNLRTEWEVFLNLKYSDEDWFKLNLVFFKDHQYYTEYGKTILSPYKAENAKLLEQKLTSVMSVDKTEDQDLDIAALPVPKIKRTKLISQLTKKEAQIAKLEEKIATIKQQKPDRGIETMFRTTYRTHIALSGIADNKANILLSINAIIISIITTRLIGEIMETPILVFPSIILVLVCLGTIIFAILATRPKVSSGTFTREDIESKRTNLLFFGNFYRMPLEDFQWGIKEMMNDSNYLYGSMSKDIYFLGVVLAKKFQLLRIAYTIFMYGMILIVLAFALTFYLQSSGF